VTDAGRMGRDLHDDSVAFAVVCVPSHAALRGNPL
jgi:hypothetical protein